MNAADRKQLKKQGLVLVPTTVVVTLGAYFFAQGINGSVSSAERESAAHTPAVIQTDTPYVVPTPKTAPRPDALFVSTSNVVCTVILEDRMPKQWAEAYVTDRGYDVSVVDQMLKACPEKYSGGTVAIPTP